MNSESEKVSMENTITQEDFVKKIMAETSAESRMALMRESLKSIKKELDQETGELTEDKLDLVRGGVRENSIAFLEAYCEGIPLDRQRVECYKALEALKQSTK